MDQNTVVAVAAAVKASAELGSDVVQAAQQLGAFLSPYLKGPLRHVTCMVEERVKFARDVRAIRYVKQLKAEMASIQGPDDVHRIPLNFAADTIAEGCLEEEDVLQDLWARLLANAADKTSGYEPRRAHISMLKDMAPLDAAVFQTIYSLDQSALQKALVAVELPVRVYSAEGLDVDALREPAHEVKLAISNLVRMGLLAYGASWSGAEIFKVVNQTYAGVEFMRAIRQHRN